MSRDNYEIGQLANRPGHGRMHGPPGMRIIEKPRNFKLSWKKLLTYSRGFLPAMIASLLCAVLGTATTLMGPDILREMTDLMTAGFNGDMDLKAISAVAEKLAALYIAGSLLLFVQGWTMATVTQGLSRKLRRAISEKINRLPLRYFDNTSIGNILSRITNDVDTLSMTMNMSLSTIVTSLTLLIWATILMLRTNVLMTAAAVGSTLIGVFAVSLILKTSQKYFRRNQALLGEINGHIEEMYAGHTVVKACNGERIAREKFESINEKLFESNWKSQFLSGLMMPVMNFIGNFGYVAVCVVGAALAMQGAITFGVIVAFTMYVRLFTQPLGQVAQAATSLQSTAAAAERVFDLLEERELEDESGKTERLTDVRGDVSFRHVRFGYMPGRPVIKDFSVDIKAGQKVAIVGPTGAGKTTLVNLLMRFYELDGGEITIDGVPISSLKRENVHDLFCMVLQDTWLFEGTIKENIIYSKKGVTDEEVVRACKAVGIDHFIRTLPHGYDTVLGENTNISAGQRQLLTIARAMVQNSPLLILDEATSSVDTRTEALVQQAMDELMKGRTSFVIAHRLSTIRNADLILVIRDGDIIESGTHDELLSKGGYYAELYNSQFEQAA